MPRAQGDLSSKGWVGLLSIHNLEDDFEGVTFKARERESERGRDRESQRERERERATKTQNYGPNATETLRAVWQIVCWCIATRGSRVADSIQVTAVQHSAWQVAS